MKTSHAADGAPLPARASTLLLALTTAWIPQAPSPVDIYACQSLQPDVTILYLIHQPSDLRATDSETAKVVERMQPIRTPRLLKWTNGWVQLGWREEGSAPDGPLRCGWLKADAPIKDNPDVLGTDFMAVIARTLKLEAKPWPIPVKADILRGRPRVGFTEEQVILTLGPPTSRVGRESPAGRVEIWTYPGRTLSFGNGKVLVVDTIK